MTRQERIESNLYSIRTKHNYRCCHYTEFDYSILKYITYHKRAGRGSNRSYNDCIIMGDTETSKKNKDVVYHNHVVAWTISIRAYGYNIVTLYGHKPSSMVKTIKQLQESMDGHDTIIYFHNLSYDWVFLRKFLFMEYGFPDHQLNTKSHYPIKIEWEGHGLILRDSLILAQRSLDKWGKDLDVVHQKAKGKWNYDIIRNQEHNFSIDEIEYIEHDTLCGVECIDALMQQLGKHIYSIPYTSTGIPREEVRKRGKKNRARQMFERVALDYDQQIIVEAAFHGGYTHGNRGLIGWVLHDVSCFDFASSYPYVMLSEKYPRERFTRANDCSMYDILNKKEDYAFLFKLILIKPILKDWDYPMPALQTSKAVKLVNAIADNGRVLAADYIEIYLTEIDLSIIESQYKYDKEICVEVNFAKKDYLPRWFTDYIFSLFQDKTVLKGGDPVSYALAKAKLNSIYGMCVQKPVKQKIKEDWESGEYWIDIEDNADLYQQYLDNHNTILPYQWGVWVTSYAFRNLFELGKCCDEWVYSDTDSCYGIGWCKEKIDEYNESCKCKLTSNGYGCVNFNNREYWLGVAEFDGAYSEYKVLGAKRYCGRSVEDGKLHITVAGVPKVGYKCLHDDINNFKQGMIFSGSVTNKKTHTHFYVEDIYIDENGNETGDSIDLSQCDYLLDQIDIYDLNDIMDVQEGKTYEYDQELLLQYYR